MTAQDFGDSRFWCIVYGSYLVKTEEEYDFICLVKFNNLFYVHKFCLSAKLFTIIYNI